MHAGPLGHGWHHNYDLALVVEELAGYAALRGADGRGIAFNVPALGEKSFNRLEKMSLLRDVRGYGVLDYEQGLTYRFGPARLDGVRVGWSSKNRQWQVLPSTAHTRQNTSERPAAGPQEIYARF